jgi:hypothetical protein
MIDFRIAVDFIKYEIKNVANAFPLMMKIHVIGLNPKYLDVYRTQFPSSVVSTICAVSIKEVSSHENECEVLLRGPFFQVLQIVIDFIYFYEIRACEDIMIQYKVNICCI